MPEVIGICDRVLVMREGHIEGEVGGSTGRAVTQENIMAYAAGVGTTTAAAVAAE
jgi:ribose transport system ATP-binding protein